jgi:hypothetical protein
MRIYYLSALFVLVLSAQAMAACGTDQQIRLETDIAWCLNYNGSAHDVLNAQGTMCDGIKKGNDSEVVSGFHDCQIGQPNGPDNIDNGLDCEREHPGIQLTMAKRHAGNCSH